MVTVALTKLEHYLRLEKRPLKHFLPSNQRVNLYTNAVAPMLETFVNQLSQEQTKSKFSSYRQLIHHTYLLSTVVLFSLIF